MKHTRHPSKMVFGSAARGDSDAYSDRDLLLVGTRGEELSSAASSYSRTGWSCSQYSSKQFARLCSRGGYFIEHLRREGKILEDPDDSLAHALATARLKVDYRAEIRQAQYLFGILEVIPQTPFGSAWALDVLMVAVRSFGYSVLAERGIFIFNYQEMLRKLNDVGVISSPARKQLAALRFWKALYRQGRYCASWEDVFPTINEVDRIMKLGLHTRLLPPNEYLETSARRQLSDYGWYARSRLLETVNSLVPNAFPQAIAKGIRAPQEYGASLSKIDANQWIDHALMVIQQDS